MADRQYAPMQRKAPPQMPPQRAAAPVPERGLGLAVAHLRVVLEEGRRGGWPAWSVLAAELTMEDRTALAELVAVLTMVPPGAAPNPDAVAAHMGFFPPWQLRQVVPRRGRRPLLRVPPGRRP